LPIIAKLLEKQIIHGIDPDFISRTGYPTTSLGFVEPIPRSSSATVSTRTNLKALHNKERCTSVFLDVSQAFDRAWHPGLLQKIKKHLPTFFPLLKSYLSNRQFRKRMKEEASALLAINSGVPQGSVLGPML
jgi:hypothetical protein